MKAGSAEGLRQTPHENSDASRSHSELRFDKQRADEKTPSEAKEASDEFLVSGKRIRLSNLAKRASKARKAFLFYSIMNSIALVAAVSCGTLCLSIAIGFLELTDANITNEDKVCMLNWLGRIVLAASFLAWVRYVFWDGWLFYPPSIPVAGRRGTTRNWYNSITFVVNEEPAEVADGLAYALNLSLRSKLRSITIMIWGIVAFASSLLIFMVTAWNVVTADGFAIALSGMVTENVAAIQEWLIFIVTFGGNSEFLIERTAAETILWDAPWAFAIFSIAPLCSLLLAHQLIVNAIDMRWSLLSTPDVMYRMLKAVLLVRNSSKDYKYPNAVTDARELVLEYGANEIPEDFMDTEGRLFFYSENMRKEFLRGSSP